MTGVSTSPFARPSVGCGSSPRKDDTGQRCVERERDARHRRSQAKLIAEASSTDPRHIGAGQSAFSVLAKLPS